MTNLIDILQRDFPNAHKRIVETMEETAGEEVLASLNSLFADQGDAMNWFYNHKLDGTKTPYDYCSEGHQDEVVKCLIRVAYGVFG